MFYFIRSIDWRHWSYFTIKVRPATILLFHGNCLNMINGRVESGWARCSFSKWRHITRSFESCNNRQYTKTSLKKSHPSTNTKSLNLNCHLLKNLLLVNRFGHCPWLTTTLAYLMYATLACYGCTHGWFDMSLYYLYLYSWCFLLVCRNVYLKSVPVFRCFLLSSVHIWLCFIKALFTLRI